MSNQSSVTIFVIEDDAIFLEIISDYIALKFPQLTICKFTNGEDALEKLQLDPKVVILDYHLNTQNKEAQNGLEVLRQIRKHDASIRVVMLSSQEKPEIAVSIMKHGAYDYIVKNETAPYRLENTLNHLTAHLILDHKVIMNKLVMVLIAAGVIALVIGLAFLL